MYNLSLGLYVAKIAKTLPKLEKVLEEEGEYLVIEDFNLYYRE